jgi:hypothetical protein
MKNAKSICFFLACGTMLPISGCTHRDAPPPTPAENSATPTYRSTTESYELDTAPRYTQSGIDGGEPATLPSIASPNRFSQNTPLAFAVYDTIRTDPVIDGRYITVFSKKGVVELTGTIKKSQLSRLLSIVHKQPGVESINLNQLQLK